jgi:hypothetical protein
LRDDRAAASVTQQRRHRLGSQCRVCLEATVLNAGSDRVVAPLGFAHGDSAMLAGDASHRVDRATMTRRLAALMGGS